MEIKEDTQKLTGKKYLTGLVSSTMTLTPAIIVDPKINEVIDKSEGQGRIFCRKYLRKLSYSPCF